MQRQILPIARGIRVKKSDINSAVLENTVNDVQKHQYFMIYILYY